MTLQDIQTIESKYNVKVLYLTVSGSKLYGTDTSSSDTDYKGVFKSATTNLLLKQDLDFIKAYTNNTSSKNTNKDIDCHLDSLHSWLKLVTAGETGALDVLFSMFRDDTIVYQDPDFVKTIKDNYLHLINKNPKAFIGYSLGQARKYAIKGARFNELTNFIDKLPAVTSEHKLSYYWPTIAELISTYTYKHIKFVTAPGPRKTENCEYLEVLGKKFHSTITYSYFLQKLVDLQNQYGNRAKHCNTNVEWKSLSHGVRVISEVQELLTDSIITFPLLDAQFVLSVKQGKIPLQQVLDYISDTIDKVDALLETTTLPEKSNQQFINRLLLNTYEGRPYTQNLFSRRSSQRSTYGPKSFRL